MDHTAGLRVGLAILCVLTTACPLNGGPGVQGANRTLSFEETEAMIARLDRQEAHQRKLERLKQEVELLEVVKTSNLLEMPEGERGNVRAEVLGEIAQLRLEGADIEGALDAVKLALESAAYATDRTHILKMRSLQVLILHYAALDAAHAGDFAKAAKFFDRAMELPGLTRDQRTALGGDRLLMMEARGTEGGARALLVASALERLIGPSEPVAPPPPVAPPKPVPGLTTPTLPDLPMANADQPKGPVTQRTGPSPFELDQEKIRAAMARDTVSEAALPKPNRETVVETGKFDSASVVRVVSANKASITACYSQALRGGTKEKGKLELMVTVQNTGSVESAKIVTAQFKSSPLGRCIADTVARWRFPPFEGDPRDVSLPFVLENIN